jgi:hypothetical protein
MSQNENVVHNGTASNASNRYGDYSAMSLDPTDDCTFWFTGMDNTSSSWRTQIASFGFDACGCELEPTPPSLMAGVGGPNVVELSWPDADLGTVVEYQVRRSRSAAGPFATIATVSDTSPGVARARATYDDTTVSGSITYYYVVVASDGECASNRRPASDGDGRARWRRSSRASRA